ncbi:MAG: hypothetical protein ACYCVY_08765, partial [Acidiferrobacteraceae bacterium]
MSHRITAIHLATIAGLTILGTATACADTLLAQNPCTGPSALLALLDRPTVGDSSCVVPDGKTVLEAGIASGRR